jgi:hypothetical protein
VGWGQAAAALLDARGVRRGRGARNDTTDTSATVADVAEELAVSVRTLRRHLALADALGPYPDLARKVDAGQLPAHQAVREAERRSAAGEARCAAAGCEAAGAYAMPHPLRIFYEEPDPLIDPEVIPPPPGVDANWYCHGHAVERWDELPPADKEGARWPLYRSDLTPETRQARLLDLPDELSGPQGARVAGREASIALDVVGARCQWLGDQLISAADRAGASALDRAEESDEPITANLGPPPTGRAAARVPLPLAHAMTD